MRLVFTFTLSLALLAVIMTFQSPTVAAQTDNLTFHDLATMTRWKLASLQVRGAMGRIGSMAVAETAPGPRGRAAATHFHTQEQIVLGLKGSTVFMEGGTIFRLGSYGAAITPPDVEHQQVNGSLTEPAAFIEFQGVLRDDWFPPFPSKPFPRAAAPAPLPADAKIFDDFSATADNWKVDGSGARLKTLSGRLIRLTVCDLSQANKPLAVVSQAGPAERFVYVIEGHAGLTSGTTQRDLGPEMLVIVSPSTTDLRLTSSGDRALVAVFEAMLP